MGDCCHAEKQSRGESKRRRRPWREREDESQDEQSFRHRFELVANQITGTERRCKNLAISALEEFRGLAKI
jgi:hypothetical protein